MTCDLRISSKFPFSVYTNLWSKLDSVDTTTSSAKTDTSPFYGLHSKFFTCNNSLIFYIKKK